MGKQQVGACTAGQQEGRGGGRRPEGGCPINMGREQALKGGMKVWELRGGLQSGEGGG